MTVWGCRRKVGVLQDSVPEERGGKDDAYHYAYARKDNTSDASRPIPSEGKVTQDYVSYTEDRRDQEQCSSGTYKGADDKELGALAFDWMRCHWSIV